MSQLADDDPQVDHLLEHLRKERGFDFTGYKRPSLLRRIGRRMQEVGVPTIGDYQDHLELHPEEYPVLFDTILIKVTEFFRDPDAWEVLREQVVPLLLAQAPAGRPLRVWSAGCATGEEAYTLAMVLVEALGEAAFGERVKIYATDIDDDALARARTGTFSARHVEALDPERRARCFDVVGPSLVFKPDLRRALIFGRHDLTRDAPISRLDLLSCRNTLMYFNAELQARVIARFHYALNDDGFLFLGKAETLLSHQNLFTPIDPRHRVFTKNRTGAPRFLELAEELLVASGTGLADAPILSRAAAVSPAAQLVVDLDGALVGANGVARAQFGITSADVGRPFQDLPVSYRPLELRSIIETAYANGLPYIQEGVERALDDGQRRRFDVTVTPLIDEGGQPLGVSIVFVDVTEMFRLREEVVRSREELQAANEELQSTNEELETSNEELQSTNEELETMNEELQSANEELETTNEELQSANEELATMNQELQRRTLDLDRSSGLLDSVVASLAVGVIVVDERLEVEIWNRAVADLFGIVSTEAVGVALASLDIGLPVDQLVDAARDAVAGARSTVAVDAVDRRGRPVRCRVGLSPLIADQRELRGAVLVVIAEGDT